MKKNKSRIYLTLTLLSISLIAMMVFSEVTGGNKLGSEAAAVFLNPVQQIAYYANEKVENVIDFYFTFDKVKKENQELKETLASYDDKIRRFDKIEKENVELKAMFEYKSRHAEYTYIGTNVINKSLNGMTPTYTLDKGSNDGIKKGMVVITYEGLAGQITDVFANHSVLETISSENVQVSVTNSGSRNYVGILTGTVVLGREHMAKVTQMSLEAVVEPGDNIVTSGIGKFYPPDIYVGKIETIAEDKGKLMKTATVIPAVKFSGGERFFIILPKNPEEMTY
ncbi:MAG: rod shape-determining protein MreC [Clostridiaceae bacterium]